jgi:hypothetical protein
MPRVRRPFDSPDRPYSQDSRCGARDGLS